MLNNIPLLDEANNVIGETTIPEAYAAGRWRRGVRIFLFNSKGELLLQKRSSTAKTHPSFWTDSAGGHVDVGETDLEAAHREMKEELGVTTSLTEIISGLRSTIPEDKVFCSVYKGVLPDRLLFALNDTEVAEVRWFSIKDFDTAVTNQTHKFTPSFLEVWQLCRDKLITT